MEESDSEAFHIYSKALLEFNQEGLSDWINYLKTIFKIYNFQFAVLDPNRA